MKPCIVVTGGGTGGHVFPALAVVEEIQKRADVRLVWMSVPPVFAAGVLGIPVISHESDFDPGLATRLNARYTRRMCVAYPESLRFYPRGKAIATGNPVRAEIFHGEASQGLGVAGFTAKDTRPVLLVVGGSLGASQLNQLVKENFEEILQRWRVIHQRGAGDWDVPDVPGAYFSRPFFSAEYPHLLAAADLVLSRAGAGSVWEIGVLGKPAVLVPLVAGSRGDQVRNAEHCRSNGAVVVFNPADYAEVHLGNLDFRETMQELAVDSHRRANMAAAWSSIVRRDGAATCAQVVLDLLSARAQ